MIIIVKVINPNPNDPDPHHHTGHPADISVLQTEVYLKEHYRDSQGQSDVTV